jgi:hypothetical protein
VEAAGEGREGRAGDSGGDNNHMTSHELAKKLLEGPDLPVAMADRRGSSYASEIADVEPGIVANYLDTEGELVQGKYLYLSAA